MFTNNAKAFLEPIDFKRCQEWSLKVLENNQDKTHQHVPKPTQEQDEQ